MAGLFDYSKEAVRVKAKKCDGDAEPEWRKFSVDPQITTYEVLRSILAKAFELRRDFSVSYRVIDDLGQETFLPLLSDWDLDAAFLGACDPCLNLLIDVTGAEEAWEPEEPPVSVIKSLKPLLRLGKPKAAQLQGLFKSQMERTLGMVQRALKPEEAPDYDPEPPEEAPVDDVCFRSFLDPLGTLEEPRAMRAAVFASGVEPSLRKVVWKHLLNVYPEGLKGKERIEYMRQRQQQYNALKDEWMKQAETPELMAITTMVRKDVLRTDRHLVFYAGNDDNKNVAALFNVLTTYAVNHPSVSYCQGMSDLASPLLVTMQDEPTAYVCFCALMRRLHNNFSFDGAAMGLKFQHLSIALRHYDPDFYLYLQQQQAGDLLFCYRWLLLELKREFAFEDALRMLEVLWASLEPDWPPPDGLQLQEAALRPSTAPSRHTAYTRLCALRRQRGLPSNKSLDELGQRAQLTTGRRPFLSLDDSDLAAVVECTSPRKVVRNLKEFQALAPTVVEPKNAKDEIFVWENPLPPSPAQQAVEDGPWWGDQVRHAFCWEG
ncbi:Hypothetical predicted protein [Cloeon dipterum]|uniref:Rab-GAP TBC domain-containing protein n=1 Tax=Cloeon dipterum TaxID=197152 RepID=A0A8S1D1Y6_9INSE|nr:Hypothetical predicted protein [Cloeon dipterum]